MNFLAVAYLFLPMFVANAAPVLCCRAGWVKRWNRPLWPSRLGNNKTYGGFVCGVGGAFIIGLVQFALQGVLPTVIGPALVHNVLFACLLGLGALAGDSAKSFYKRGVGIKPGEPLPIIDGVDYVLGALVFATPYLLPTQSEIIFLLIIGPVLSLLANSFSYCMGWKEVWY